jgi:hypothetical protein
MCCRSSSITLPGLVTHTHERESVGHSSEDESMIGLLKSMDRLAKESDLFRCFCGPSGRPETELLSKLKWYNGTVMPYYYYTNDIHLAKKQEQQTRTRNEKDITKYCRQVMTNIAGGTSNKQLCCMDFLINDIAKSSLKHAMTVEQVYDNNRLSGLVYCNYKTEFVKFRYKEHD